MYQNFQATRAWSESRKMLEGERQAVGVLAELTGMASSSVGSGLHQLAEDCDLLVVGSPAAAGSRVVCLLEMTPAGR